MIAVAIISIVFMIGPRLIVDITRLSSLNRARLETLGDARDTLSVINRTLRQASMASIVVTQETGQPPYSSISFKTSDGRLLKYYQSNQNLEFVNNGSTGTLTNNLRFIAFTYPRTDDSSIISVSVTFEKATYEGGAKALQMAIEKVRIMND